MMMKAKEKSPKPGEISHKETGAISPSLTECPVCHSTLPSYDAQPGFTFECSTCYADLEVATDLSRLIFRKFGGKAFGQL